MSARPLHEIHLDTGAVLRVKAANVRVAHTVGELRSIEWVDADPKCCPLWLNVDRVVAIMVVP